jgi:hypothetical protein
MPTRLLAGLASFVVLAAALAWHQPGGDPPQGPLPAVAGAPKYWKGNLHTHSLWSVGDDFPEMIADWYKRHA